MKNVYPMYLQERSKGLHYYTCKKGGFNGYSFFLNNFKNIIYYIYNIANYYYNS